MQLRYIRMLLSLGESISVKVSPSFSPPVQRVIWDVSIPCSAKYSVTKSPNWSFDTLPRNPAFIPWRVTPTAMFAGDPPTNFSNICTFFRGLNSSFTCSLYAGLKSMATLPSNTRSSGLAESNSTYFIVSSSTFFPACIFYFCVLLLRVLCCD